MIVFEEVKMEQYLKKSDIQAYLEKKFRFAKQQRDTEGKCDDIQDAYWQGQMDAISEAAEEFDIIKDSELSFET